MTVAHESVIQWSSVAIAWYAEQQQKSFEWRIITNKKKISNQIVNKQIEVINSSHNQNIIVYLFECSQQRLTYKHCSCEYTHEID